MGEAIGNPFWDMAVGSEAVMQEHVRMGSGPIARSGWDTVRRLTCSIIMAGRRVHECRVQSTVGWAF